MKAFMMSRELMDQQEGMRDNTQKIVTNQGNCFQNKIETKTNSYEQLQLCNCGFEIDKKIDYCCSAFQVTRTSVAKNCYEENEAEPFLLFMSPVFSCKS